MDLQIDDNIVDMEDAPEKFVPLVTRWVVRPAAPPKEVKQLSKDLGIPPLLASILYARGFRDASLEWAPASLDAHTNSRAERSGRAFRARPQVEEAHPHSR